MQFKPTTHEGYKLLLEGAHVLSRMEHNGFCIDTKYLDKTIERVTARCQELEDSLRNDKVYKVWRKQYGPEMNMDSNQQLGHVLFDVLGIDGGVLTRKGSWKTDKNSLRHIDLPFMHTRNRLAKLRNANSTFLRGIRRHISNGYLHPHFLLHIARSYRSSSADPNLQNIPIRDPEISGLVRPAFIPRSPDRCITEHDFSGIEVKVAGCYNHDPMLLKYIKDKRTDMHRDMGMQCFKLKLNQITKDTRQTTKSNFVFPQFYGDWFLSCAISLWDEIGYQGLTTAQGVPLKKHLRRHGITGLGDIREAEDTIPGTFIHHIKEVEEDFWGNRFKVYDKWKRDWWDDYCDNGYFDTYTGFRIAGTLNRKQVVNYPIQGSAFHCLLWCLIRIQKLLLKYRMKTLLIGQIHDSVLADVPVKELEDYKAIAHQVMTVDLLKHWRWIVVPMEVDAEVAPPGRSWFEKE